MSSDLFCPALFGIVDPDISFLFSTAQLFLALFPLFYFVLANPGIELTVTGR